ncbi:tetratricopeptide repeat protein [Verrucomicrobiota bacterium]
MHEETDKQILDELRRLNAFAQKSTKMNVIAVSVLCIFVVLFLVSISLRHRLYSRTTATSQGTDSWHEVRSLMDTAQYDKAKAVVQALIEKSPDYYYGYSYLAGIHLAEGNLVEAEASFEKAYGLFPLEENEDNLIAIRKALESQKTE